MHLNAIIVDDEPPARSILRQILLDHCPIVHVLAEAPDVTTAVKLINNEKVDLVFLDIEMPVENGFALFDYFKRPTFQTIFCTAYSAYAIKAFEVSAVDYLLKPVSISKILYAVEKAVKLIGQNQIIEKVQILRENLSVNTLQKIALPMADGLVFVELKDILYFEADGSYTLVVTSAGKILVSKKIKEFDDILENDLRFYRTHRSFLVNTSQILKYNKKDGASLEFANGQYIPVAREKVKEFDEFIANIRV